MSADLIIISGVSAVSLDITPEAESLKAAALNRSRGIVAVSDSETQEIAVDALSEIKSILKQLENSRNDIKRPVLDLGKRIDGKAAEYAKELTEESNRLHGAIQRHFRNEKEKADAELRMARALESKRRAKAEEEARIALEESRKAAKASLNAKSESEAARLDAEAGARAQEAIKAQEASESVTLIPTTAPAKAEKMTVRTVWKHRVVDMHALVKSRPELVIMEAKTATINAEIRGGAREIPGLEIWEETDVSVRS